MGYKPTEAICNNSMKGFALLQKNNSLKAKQKSKELEAISKSLQGELELHEVQSLYFNLLKAKDKYNPKQLLADYNVTPDTASFLALGGNAALAWASAIVNKSTEDKSKVDTEDEIPGIKLEVAKALDEELRVATFLVLEPQYEGYETSDLHSDWYSESEVFQAMKSFNLQCSKAALWHRVITDSVQFLESYCTKADCTLGGRYIRKGSWLASIYCPPDDEVADYVWKSIKDGSFTGLSIQCLAETERLE